jgi:putative tricarboxylic transport membrane protein
MTGQPVPREAQTVLRRQTYCGGGLILAAIAVMTMSLQVGPIENSQMGAGLWPFLAATLLLVSAVAMMLGRPRAASQERPDFAPRPFILAIAVLFGFGLLLTSFGIFTASAVAAFVWLKFLAGESWRLSAIIAIVLGAVLYGLFIQILDIPLPVDAFLPR